MLKTTFNEQEKVFCGRKSPPIYNPNAFLGRLLFSQYLSREDNYASVGKWTSVLRSQVSPGDVINSIVAGLGPDEEQLIHFYVAAILNGNPIHFLDHRSGAVEVESAVRVTGAKSIQVFEGDCEGEVDNKG